ncbi:MAG: ATP-dependent Clp protease ATP-binding subunit [Thermotogaceae bacterium]|nr:ATP-dependent Clp protease ATP-binding subunit [Thermotogaceae bacterium]
MFFEKFSEKAAQIFVTAQEEAKELGHSYVGTEHILLALLKVGDSAASEILGGMGITYSRTKSEIISMVGMGMRGFITSPQMTPRAKRVTELAYEEAKILGSEKIMPEHLLLGIIREGEGIAIHVLSKLGIDLQILRREIIDTISDEPGVVKKRTHQSNSVRQLEGFGVDLTELAAKGELDPIIGREEEIERIMQILVRRKKNNPVLIGEPGVGKTAIVEGLAQRIVEGEVPEPLRNKVIFSLDVASLVAGTKYRGEFEKRMKKLLQVVTKDKSIILFIDEIHTIVGAGSAEGAVDAANILKPALARGDIKCIGATTPDEYRKYIEKDAALERRFQKIYVKESTEEETLEILEGLKMRYENHHKVRYTDDAIKAAVTLSKRYITDHFLPDKAIDLIDEAGARARLKVFTIPAELKFLKMRLDSIRSEKEIAVKNQDYEKAAALKEEEKQLEREYKKQYQEWKINVDSKIVTVTAEDIAEVVSSWTGIPLMKLEETESEKLLKLEEALHQRIVGQDEAIKSVSKAIRRARSGIKDPKRPIGVFLFLGPTGVGKTELAKALAEHLFGDENALIRFDMSEYMERFAMSRLIGAPPGYVGYDEGGSLTEKIRRRPFSVILFDEIEKAHPDIFNLLLQIMDEGRLTDSQGKEVDFRNTIVIMTSNLGGELINRSKKSLGFAASNSFEEEYEEIKKLVMSEVKKTFRPEFLNRIDEIVVFHSLTKEHVYQIIDIILRDLKRRLAEMGIEIRLTKEAKDFLIEKGFNPLYGARPMKRTIQKYIEDPLSEEILKGRFKERDTIIVRRNGEELKLTRGRKKVGAKS